MAISSSSLSNISAPFSFTRPDPPRLSRISRTSLWSPPNRTLPRLATREQLLLVVGAGATGIYVAIRTKRVAPHLRVLVVEKGKFLSKLPTIVSIEVRRGKELHLLMITSGFGSNMFSVTVVLNMYAKCHQIDYARKAFDRMPQRYLVAWNVIIACYVQNGLARRSLEMITLMQEEGKRSESITLVTVLFACADTGFVRIGRSIHGFVMRAGFEILVNVSTAMLNMYSKCGLLATMRLVFYRMKTKNAVSWNSLIDGYAQSGAAMEAIKIIRTLLGEGITPTDVTILGALHACADLGDLDKGNLFMN